MTLIEKFEEAVREHQMEKGEYRVAAGKRLTDLRNQIVQNHDALVEACRAVDEDFVGRESNDELWSQVRRALEREGQQ